MMKKVFFTALILLGYSTLTIAQEAAAAARRPQVDEAKSAKAEPAKAAPSAQPAKAKVRAGMTDQEAAGLNQSIQTLEEERKIIASNTQLTAAEKEKAMQSLEAQRVAILKKSLGAEGYKKYEADRKAEMKAQKSN